MIILVMGPQGSGKTTQAQLLAQAVELPFLSMGRILRFLYEANEPQGVEAKKHWEKGDLVPDRLVEEILRVFFLSRPHPKGFIMEGFPRDLAQYSWMKNVFPEDLTAVVELTIDPDEIQERIEKRRETEKRADETPEAVKKRLNIYFEETTQLLDKFEKDQVPVIKVNGVGEIEDIHQAIIHQIKHLQQTTSN